MSLFQEFMTFDSSYPRMAAMIYMVSSIIFTGAARGVAKAWEGKGGGATKALHSTVNHPRPEGRGPRQFSEEQKG